MSDERSAPRLQRSRPCARCGYNLVHQQVQRDERLNLRFVRCPECGTVASLQEHPVLGAWATRWGHTLAALWILLVAGIVLASTMAFAGIAHGAGRSASTRFAEWIATRYQAEVGDAETSGYYGAYSVTQEFMNWIKRQDVEALLVDAGGMWKIADWNAAWIWIPGAGLGLAIGALWSILLLRRRRVVVVLWMAAHVCVSVPWLWILLDTTNRTTQPWASAWTVASETFAKPFALVTLGVIGAALIAGAIFGRALARGCARALLPPSLQGALAEWWTRDGKEPPLPPPGG